jgi:hypothetical protein
VLEGGEDEPLEALEGARGAKVSGKGSGEVVLAVLALAPSDRVWFGPEGKFPALKIGSSAELTA